MSLDNRHIHAQAFRGGTEFRAPWMAWVQIAAIFVLLCVAILWAYLAVLDEVASGEGRVIPSSRLQVVQTLEGGIVREIFVSEGDIVESGEILFRIDDIEFASRLGELKQRWLALNAQIARLKAEALEAEAMVVEAAVDGEMNSLVGAELESFLARQTKHLHDKAILESQLHQREQELQELEAGRAKILASSELLRREVEAARRLSASGAVPEIELLRLERQMVDAEGELAVLSATIPKARAAIEEARSKVAYAQSRARSDAHEELAKRLADLSVVEHTLRSAEDRVMRTAVTAPVRGIVNRLGLTTVGAVAQPGFGLAEIVPLEDSLLIEVKIAPRDVAFIHPGQHARVKLTAYEYLVYGPLDGEVERISADSFTDERDQTFYRVTVRTEQNHIEKNGVLHPILPGMVASVDILTGRKSVLEYLMNPILRARDDSMRER
jgi:membrane fusion protein, adhesin transport system